jgi:hypothetical protein
VVFKDRWARKWFSSYEISYDRAWKNWLFNTGDCLTELTTWAGLTVLTNISPIEMFRDTNVSEVYYYYTFPHILFQVTDSFTLVKYFICCKFSISSILYKTYQSNFNS